MKFKTKKLLKREDETNLKVLNQAKIIEQLMLKGGMGISKHKGVKDGIDPKVALQIKDKIEAVTIEYKKVLRDFNELSREKLKLQRLVEDISEDNALMLE